MASLLDFRTFAQSTMSPALFASLDSGAGDQVTLGLNQSDFPMIKMKQRGMANMKYFKNT